jgi:hypothetical protein
MARMHHGDSRAAPTRLGEVLEILKRQASPEDRDGFFSGLEDVAAPSTARRTDV